MEDLIGLAKSTPKKPARKKYQRRRKSKDHEQRIDAKRLNALIKLCITQFGFVFDDHLNVTIDLSKQIEKPYTYREACNYVDAMQPEEDKSPLASKQERLNSVGNSFKREFARRLEGKLSKDAINVKWQNFKDRFTPREHGGTHIHITPSQGPVKSFHD